MPIATVAVGTSAGRHLSALKPTGQERGSTSAAIAAADQTYVFGHLTLRKALCGDLALPIVRVETLLS